MNRKAVTWGLIILLYCLGWVAVCARACHSDPLPIHCTAPRQNNTGTCDAPILTTAGATDSLWVIFDIVGPGVARRDSVWRRPGGDISLNYNLPRGTYAITATALRKAPTGTLLYSCPMQKTASTQVTPPWAPTFAP